MSLISFTPPVYSAVNAIFEGTQLDTISCQKLGHIIYNSLDSDFINRAIARCKNKINIKFSTFKISPLHLAAMKGRVDVATLLIENGASLESEDHKKYTPLHHAALTGNDRMVSLLKRKWANEFAENIHGGTYLDIQRLTRQLVDTSYSINDLEDAINNNTNLGLNPSCFNSNVTLVMENVITPQQLVDRWATKLTQTKDFQLLESIQADLLKKYAVYKANPPDLIVDHLAQDDGFTLMIPSYPCGVFAGQTIKAGQIIREYVGQIVDGAQKDKTYFFKDIDATTFRNEASMMMNDKTHNGIICPIYNVNGLEVRWVIIASNDIQPGQEIIVSPKTL